MIIRGVLAALARFAVVIMLSARPLPSLVHKEACQIDIALLARGTSELDQCQFDFRVTAVTGLLRFSWTKNLGDMIGISGP